MEPRPYGRGDMIQPHSAGQTASASMEPRPYGRGDPSHFPGQMRSARLQWSHGHTAVETRPGRRGRSRGGASFNGATAIRSWRRETPHANDRHDQLASMEPRPYGRGDATMASARRRISWRLQWSHGHTAVETRVVFPAPVGP